MNESEINTPKVSVIIPVWNPDEGISRCVASLRNQTLTDIEMIFVDDRGTDGAMNVVRAVAEEDPRIRILANAENMGPGASRNAGIEVARGEYLAFVDADDYVDLDFLEILYEKGKKENLDVVKGDFLYECGCGEVFSKPNKLNDIILNGLQKGKPLFFLFRYEFQSAIFRNTLFTIPYIRFGLSTNGEDITFLLKACYAAKSFGIDNRVAYHYLYRATSGSNTIIKVRLDGRIAALRDQIEFLITHVEPDPYAKKYLLRRIKYYLSLERYVARTVGMEDEAVQFLADLQAVVSDYPDIDVLKDKDMVFSALVDYGEGLAEWPYSSPWSSPSAKDYWDVFASWVGFLTAHPERYRQLPKVFEKAQSFEKRMIREGKIPEELEWFHSQVEIMWKHPPILKMRMKIWMRNSKLGCLWAKCKRVIFLKR